MNGANAFAVFRKKGWPDLGPIPVLVRAGGNRGSIHGGNFIQFDYTVAWDTQYVFRDDNGNTTQIDGTTSMLCPDYNNGDPVILNIPRRTTFLQMAKANFNVEQ